jgi:hypothetical protein
MFLLIVNRTAIAYSPEAAICKVLAEVWVQAPGLIRELWRQSGLREIPPVIRDANAFQLNTWFDWREEHGGFVAVLPSEGAPYVFTARIYRIEVPNGFAG